MKKPFCSFHKVAMIAVLGFSIFTLQTSNSFAVQSKIYKVSTANNKKTINIRTGDQIILTLDSTYWAIDPVDNTKLKPQGDPLVTPIMPGPDAPEGCKLPGSGCGTIVWKLKAIKKGVSFIKASRQSCGEALKCTPEQSSFQLRLNVK
jgi:hypothetical protein